MVRKNSSTPRKRKVSVKSTRRQPPKEFITSSEAEAMLGNRMLYKYVKQNLIEKYTPPLSKYGFYKLSDVEKVRKSLMDEPISEPEPEAASDITFARATPDDMEGVYNVAIELFPAGTTSANARKPLIAVCPDGNYIVRDQGQIVAYLHLQPLKPEVMKAFLKGEIRGKDIKVQHIDPFATGKSVDVLVKSIGSTRKNGEEKSAHYTQRLLLGTARELEKMGKQGIIIRKVYATSETISGITMATHARMRQLRTLERPHEGSPGRYAYELDVATSDLALLQPYKRALAEWRKNHSTQD